MKKKMGGRFFAALVIFSLIGQIAWVVENMYFNVFLYEMFNASASDISTMVAASAVAATLTTIFIGSLSDRIGKRKVFICAGYILWGISILAFAALRADIIEPLFPTAASVASAGVSLVIIFDCVMTFFGSSANDACFNAWLTDSTDDTNRGRAEGINAMMPMMAIIVVFGGTMWADTSNAAHWSILFMLIGIIVLITGILGIFLIKEDGCAEIEKGKYFGNIFYGFRPSVIKNNSQLYITLAAFTIFGISIQIFMPYLILYYTEALHLDNYVFIMAPAIIIAGIATAFYGRVYDKKGYIPSLVPTLILLVIGYAFLALFKNTVLVFAGSLFMITGYLTATAVFGAMIRNCTPKGMAGRFQGLRIVGQVLIPGVVGPAIGAAVLKGADTVLNTDGTTSFIPNANIYIAAAIMIIPVAAVIIIHSVLARKTKA